MATTTRTQSAALQESVPWWPQHLGDPSTHGTAADLRYAFFPHITRLAIQLNDVMSLYDTGHFQFRGALQVINGRLTCETQRGRMALADFPVIS